MARRIFSVFPSKSPFVVLICPMVTRMNTSPLFVAGSSRLIVAQGGALPEVLNQDEVGGGVAARGGEQFAAGRPEEAPDVAGLPVGELPRARRLGRAGRSREPAGASL